MTVINEQTAVQLVYLVAGIDEKLRIHRVTQRLTDCKDHTLVAGGGHIGMVTDLLPWAAKVAKHLAAKADMQDFPGVFEYEVTEELGSWAADAAQNGLVHADDFEAELNRLSELFFAQSALPSS